MWLKPTMRRKEELTDGTRIGDVVVDNEDVDDNE